MDRDWGSQFRRVVGDGMRRCRLASRLSREAVAQALSVSKHQYIHFERGLSHPSSETLLRLASFLDVPPREFNRGMAALVRAASRNLDDVEQTLYGSEPAAASRLRVSRAATEIKDPKTLSTLACLTEFLAELDRRET